jgi:hypothetical protein
VLVQRTPVNLLVVEGLAGVVEDALHEQPQQVDTDQNAHQHGAHEQPARQAEPEAPLLTAPLDDGGPEQQRGDAAQGEVGDDERGGRAGAPLEQLFALRHGGEPADRLEHGDDAGKVPERGDVDVDPEEDEDDEEEEDEEGEGRRGRLSGVGDENDYEEDDGEGEADVVGEHEEGDPEEGAEEAGQDGRQRGERGGDGRGLGGVERGDGEDGAGGGEEGEDEEDDEVEELVDEEAEPLRGLGVDAVGAAVLDAEEDGVGEEGVRQHREGEREDEAGGEQREGARRRARDRGGDADQLRRAQRGQVLRRQLHRRKRVRGCRLIWGKFGGVVGGGSDW